MNPAPAAAPAAQAALVAPPKQEPPLKPLTPPVTQTDQVSDLLSQVLDDMENREIRHRLIEQELSRLQFNNDYRLAKMFSEAGYFDSAGYKSPPMTAEQAMAKIEVGRSWGINPADSIRFIFIVNGKPSVEESVFASRLQSAGWSWEPQFIGGEGPMCKGVRLFIEKDGKPYMKPKRKDSGDVELDSSGQPIMRQVTVEFTEEMARLIKVFENGQQIPLINKKGPWSDGWRSNMMYWRCLAQFRRFHVPHVMSGALLRDELRDIGPIEDLTVEKEPVRASVLDKIDAELGKKAAPPEEQQAAKTTATVSEAAPGPPPLPEATKATLASIKKFEATMGTDVFFNFLAWLNYPNGVDSIKSEPEALAVLKGLQDEASKPPKKKA